MIHQHKEWLRDGWNWLDAIIVVTAVASYIFSALSSEQLNAVGMNNSTQLVEAGSDEVASTKAIRALRVLRPLRTIKRFPHLKSTVRTLLKSIPATLGVLTLFFFALYTMAILGVQLQMSSAYDGDADSLFHFDDFGASLLTLFSISGQLSQWPSTLWRASSRQSEGLLQMSIAAFIVVFVFIGSIMVNSLYLAILVNQYQEVHDQVRHLGSVELDHTQLK